MADPTDLTDNPFSKYLDVAIDFARGGEKIAALLRQVPPFVEGLKDLHKFDATLEPELNAALDQVDELHATLMRAFKFLEARHDQALVEAKAALPGLNHEGGAE